MHKGVLQSDFIESWDPVSPIRYGSSSYSLFRTWFGLEIMLLDSLTRLLQYDRLSHRVSDRVDQQSLSRFLTGGAVFI